MVIAIVEMRHDGLMSEMVVAIAEMRHDARSKACSLRLAAGARDSAKMQMQCWRRSLASEATPGVRSNAKRSNKSKRLVQRRQR